VALRAAGFGCFPSGTRPRVVWADVVAGVAPLAALAADVQQALVPLGYVPEARPFRAHLTLGRVRSPRGVRALVDAVAAAGAPDFGAWTAGEVVLYRSHLHPKGARYEPLARPRLAAVAPHSGG
jgi:2'-5' RNA ligase